MLIGVVIPSKGIKRSFNFSVFFISFHVSSSYLNNCFGKKLILIVTLSTSLNIRIFTLFFRLISNLHFLHLNTNSLIKAFNVRITLRSAKFNDIKSLSPIDTPIFWQVHFQLNKKKVDARFLFIFTTYLWKVVLFFRARRYGKILVEKGRSL